MQTFKRKLLTINPALLLLQPSAEDIVKKSSEGWQITLGSDLGGSGSTRRVQHHQKISSCLLLTQKLSLRGRLQPQGHGASRPLSQTAWSPAQSSRGALGDRAVNYTSQESQPGSATGARVFFCLHTLGTLAPWNNIFLLNILTSGDQVWGLIFVSVVLFCF